MLKVFSASMGLLSGLKSSKLNSINHLVMARDLTGLVILFMMLPTFFVGILINFHNQSSLLKLMNAFGILLETSKHRQLGILKPKPKMLETLITARPS